MRKLFLIFTAMLLCSISVFAQERDASNRIIINSPEEFLKIGTTGYSLSDSYILTEDINLGDFGDRTSAIIPTFYGTFDGDGHTITYQASFTADNEEDKLALFGTVTGKIQNLRISNSTITSNGTNTAQIALLCANLSGNNGRITDCEIFSGNINSTISATGDYERVATGLLVGLLSDGARVEYCSATGNVVGYGYVGGLVGQASNGHVHGSSFVGSVEAAYEGDPNWNWRDYIAGAWLGTGRGSYAGGIIGYADNSSSINLCYVKADVVSEELGIQGLRDYYYLFACTGVGATNNDSFLGNTGTPQVTNCYAEGTVNGEPINTTADLTNSANTNNDNNYYEGATIQNCTKTNAECIVDALNGEVPEDERDKIQFSVSDDDNVIFGVVSTESVCETPTNLTITKNDDGTYTASWEVVAVDEEAPIEFVWTLKREKVVFIVEWSDPVLEQNVWSISTESPLDASLNAYTFYVKSKCSEDLFSEEVSIPFYVDCPTPTNLTASNITDNGFTIFWDADVECQVKLNSGEPEVISSTNNTKTYENLLPETQYTVAVKAKCGDEYVEQASINVTTARLAAPTGLAVNTVWNGSVERGTATITWDMVDGLTYEIEGQTENKESGFAITGLAENNYTLRLRAKKGTKTSDWVSMPYTISSPDAPKNPQVEYTINGSAYDVTVSWTAGSIENDGWKVNGGEVQNTASYVWTAQTPGYVTTLSIVEKVGESTSGALQVPIQVPCLPATLPDTVITTQTSATFTFSQAIANRKVIIGSDEYEASATSITIDELTSGTTYSYEVREYCNETQYSSVIENFATVGCFAVKNLSVSNIGVTNATISWESQSTLAGLNYQITVNEETKPEQTDTTITLTGLTSATEYTIVVKEQCGEDWGEERTITFTTESGNYVTAKDGDFDFPDTWDGNKVPTGNFGNITIKHNVTLSHSLTLSGSCRISNEGVLKITSQGELINTTGNNVGGIIEVETPQKDMDKWTFIGAPFENYKLETIKPVSGSDISVSLYDYDSTKWDYEWALYNSQVGKGEGYFAWPFYKGVVTYTTYGDLFVWNAEGTSGTIMTSYDFSQPAKYQLNNAETFTVTKNVQGDASTGRWMALSNPYPAKLSVDKFVAANNTNIASGSETSGNTTIQGKCIYKLTNNVSNNKQTWDVVFANNANEKVKDIAMTEGFFVNLASGNQVTFSKTQLTNYPTTQAKSQVAPREFVELSLVKGNHKSKLYFAHNQEAEQNYDIFDANKLFAIGEIAEPYFVTEGIALVKEEVKELPYYATMNVRSYKDDTVSFVVKNIPKDMSVFIIDNEEEIKMSEDVAYTTHISEGENADRFQVLFKKASVIEEAKDSEITITNTNRLVRVESTQTDLRIEVYNALGQKVFATNDYNFTLNEVSAGTYMIKAYNRITTQTAKIVVE